MAKKDLDRRWVCAGFCKICSKAMAKGVRACRYIDRKIFAIFFYLHLEVVGGDASIFPPIIFSIVGNK